MLDLYKHRVTLLGHTVGESLIKNSDLIMDANFTNDVSCKNCYINNELVLAKFQRHTTDAFNKEVVDYRLQFKSGVSVPIGTFVNIPNELDVYEPWMVVGKVDDVQFVKYLILKCNWTFKWIYKEKIYSCLGVISSKGTDGVYSDDFSTTATGNLTFWLPSSEKTQTITYEKRFLITENLINPLVYKVVGINETSPIGITRFTASKDQYDPINDNLNLMIADYFKTNKEPDVYVENPDLINKSEITCNGTTTTLKLGGSYKTLTATFYNSNGDPNYTVNPVWSFTLPLGKEDKFEIIDGGTVYQKKIRVIKDYDLIGSFVTVHIQDQNHLFPSTIELEVVAI